MNDSDAREFEEPNLRAEFYGGRLDGWLCFFAFARPEFAMIVPVKDENGVVVKKQVVMYRLASKGPPLLYRFVSAEDYTGESSV